MDEGVRERIRAKAETYALVNALEHDSDAQVSAIMGSLLGDHPEFREYGNEIPELIGPVVTAVNDLDSAAKEARLEELAPERLSELTAPESDDDDEDALPSLPNADAHAEIRMRLAPNPNGPWHIGHARMPAVIGTYKDQYDGWFMCRFDDTDPETKRPVLEAYEWILEDIAYLGFEPDLVVNASDRLSVYYEYARDLIEHGGAYTCSCPQAEFSELKNEGVACPHREKSRDTIESEFEALVAGEFAAGEMVLRVKTDIEHPNPALRDWVAFRVIETPHPRPVAEDYRCWPTLDFQSGIDDHEYGITHIIRGIDLQDSAHRQRFVYDYFDWDYPEVVHWGRVEVDEFDVSLSTSMIGTLIEQGMLDGWDDPRAPTLMSLRRRGIQGAAITEAMVELGTSTSNVELAMSTVYSNNRELIDADADRLFMVRDGIEKHVVGGPAAGEPPVHPEDEDRGVRHLDVGGAVLVEADDVPANGERVWLKGFGCVRHTRGAFEWTGDDIGVVRDDGVPVVHWVPAGTNRAVRLWTPMGDEDGRVEATITSYDPGAIVQFERVCFARIDAVTEDEIVAFYAHP